jgi:hypothetical protein
MHPFLLFLLLLLLRSRVAPRQFTHAVQTRQGWHRSGDSLERLTLLRMHLPTPNPRMAWPGRARIPRSQPTTATPSTILRATLFLWSILQVVPTSRRPSRFPFYRQISNRLDIAMARDNTHTRQPTLLRVLKNLPSVQAGADPTAGELAIAHLKAHVAFHASYEAAPAPASSDGGAPSLSDLATQKIIDSLSEDTTPESLQILLNNCPQNLLSKVLANSTLSYMAFRMLGTVCADDADAEGAHGALHVRELDEWVLGNERAMRKLAVKEQMRMLVDLERDGDAVWPESEVRGEVRTLVRKEPPRETFAVLGEARETNFRILKSTKAFAERFHSMTNGVLEGLDWSNCFVAGGMALSTLMCVEDQMEERWKGSDIDMYIYGLPPDLANEKVREIYDVWWKNLGPTKTTFCVKNAKTITFISDYPERRIQVCR